mmetsp:Transcript_27323/g.26366  ORF Transcript_27323/g.26366 Transcript_27323/m.26366 type:complete len:98 (-) Transcript_27323:40-333(-)
MLLAQKNADRKQEIVEYQEEQKNALKNMSEEEQKNERIKKGMAALSIGGVQDENQIQQKRKNFMHDIRDALISGDQEDGEAKVVTKKRKKKPQADPQ